MWENHILKAHSSRNSSHLKFLLNCFDSFFEFLSHTQQTFLACFISHCILIAPLFVSRHLSFMRYYLPIASPLILRVENQSLRNLSGKRLIWHRTWLWLAHKECQINNFQSKQNNDRKQTIWKDIATATAAAAAGAASPPSIDDLIILCAQSGKRLLFEWHKNRMLPKQIIMQNDVHIASIVSAFWPYWMDIYAPQDANCFDSDV